MADKILVDLTCPICWKSASSEIRECGIGHIVCNFCYDNIMHQCPVCLSSKQEIQPVDVIELSNTDKVECKHSPYGCEKKEYRINIKFHEKYCEFKLLKCPLTSTSCRWVGIKKDRADHFRVQHPTRFFSATDLDLTYRRFIRTHRSQPKFIVEAYQKLFKLEWRHCLRTNLQHALVTFVDAPSLRRFRYNVTFVHPSGFTRSLSDDVSNYNKEESQTCLNGVRDFVDENGSLHYYLSIRDGGDGNDSATATDESDTDEEEYSDSEDSDSGHDSGSDSDWSEDENGNRRNYSDDSESDSEDDSD